MNLLLDTHVFLWCLTNPKQLTPQARQSITNPENTVYVSAASIWEIYIKKALGKINLKHDLLKEIEWADFKNLPITAVHAMAIEKLPNHHHDPFDRLLIAQAQCENLHLATRDRKILKYEINVIES